MSYVLLDDPQNLLITLNPNSVVKLFELFIPYESDEAAQLVLRATFQRLFAHNKIVQRDSQAPHIHHRGVMLGPDHQLWGLVARSASSEVVLRPLVVEINQVPVDDLNFRSLCYVVSILKDCIHDDVQRLDVHVEEPLGDRLVELQQNLEEHDLHVPVVEQNLTDVPAVSAGEDRDRVVVELVPRPTDRVPHLVHDIVLILKSSLLEVPLHD